MQDEFKSRALAAADQAPEAPWFANQRGGSRDAFAALDMPNRKIETWKYNDLAKVYGAPVEHAAAGELDAARVLGSDLFALDSARVTLLDGRYCAELSNLPDGVEVAAFSQASTEQQSTIRDMIGKHAQSEGQAFVLLNEALSEDGVFVDVEKGQSVEQPLHVVSLRTAGGAAAPRLLMRVADSASVVIAEHHRSVDGLASFDVPVSEIQMGANSDVTHYRFALGADGYRHIGRVATTQADDSRYKAYLAVLGGDFNRLDFCLDIQGQNCESSLYGLYMCRGNDHTDIHLAVDHAMPRCNSQEVFRGMAAEQGKAVFNGRIHIHPDAQKTNAELSNRNLLLSRTAEINTKPELEIYADDVKCAHGATVGQLDAEALFYLRSRGTPLESARSLLSYGFINEVLLALPDQTMAALITPRVDAFFNGLSDG